MIFQKQINSGMKKKLVKCHTNGERDYMRQLALNALNSNNAIFENCFNQLISLIDNCDDKTNTKELINLGKELLKLNNNYKFVLILDARERANNKL